MLQAGRLCVYKAVAHFSPRIVKNTLRNEYWSTLLELIVQKLERATIGEKSYYWKLWIFIVHQN